jgi:IS30 family transposase
MATRFSRRMLPGVQQQAWERYRLTGDLCEAAAAIGVSRSTVQNWIKESGGIRPRGGRVGKGVRIQFEERMEIQVRKRHGDSLSEIAAGLGRPTSAVSREVKRHLSADGSYSATHAQQQASDAAARPQVLKLGVDTVHVELRERVIADLVAGFSPEQVAGRLRAEFGSDPEQLRMCVHHETIYRAVYLQARGGLKREVEAAQRAQRAAAETDMQLPASVIRSNRAARKPRTVKPTTGRGQIPGMVSIRDRPPIRDTDGVFLPGHLEGDLIVGAGSRSAIGTMVERSTGYLWLLHLPSGHTAAEVAAALTAKLIHWPAHLKQSLTWDQGKEMSRHAQVSVDANIKIYFADPHSPWQRPGNENINGLLRQYFPKGTDLSVHTSRDLDYVQELLNNRPRARFAYAKPNELMHELLLR